MTDTFEASGSPLPIRVANLAGHGLDHLGLRIGLSREHLLSRAKRQTGIAEFADMSFNEPLSVLLESIDKEAQLNLLGRFITRQMIIAGLANRLKIQEHLQRNPHLLASPIRRPLFIVGYPRTGTTLLHNLLSLDRDNRTLKMYESLSPVPPKSKAGTHEDPRLVEAERFIKLMHYLSSQIPVIHPLNARWPDECLKLIEYTFVSPHFLLYFNLPKYWKWLLSRPPAAFTAVYEYHRRQLQILSQGEPDSRWVLKAPVHLFYLDALLKIYPDARIVLLHRAPEQAIPSFCSLMAITRAMATDHLDKKAIGTFALALFQMSHTRAASARAGARDPAQFLDVDYRNLVANPIDTVHGIYEHFGETVGSDFDGSMSNWLAQNPQHKHGVHRYSMESFGLAREQLNHVRSTLSR